MLQSRQGFGHLLRRTITEFQGFNTYLQAPGSISYLPSATFQQLPFNTYLQSTVQAPTYNPRFLHLPTSTHSTDYPTSSLLSESAGPRDLRDLHANVSGPTLHHLRRDYCGAASDLPSLPATDQDSGVLRRTRIHGQLPNSRVLTPTYKLRVPSATFHQLPSSSYLSTPTYNLRFKHLPTIPGFCIYLHLPTQPTTLHLHYYPSLLDLVTSVTFTPTSAGLPCITYGGTTAELRATYPLYRLLTRIVVFYQRTRFHYALDIRTHTRLDRHLPTYLPEYKNSN
ncbi:hypothetical protein SFRURICE_006940 [Spodoptera frugiperda]|nr:hypothetical protein SFRURICE_006940 [Spodoptera frugiperda]